MNERHRRNLWQTRMLGWHGDNLPLQEVGSQPLLHERPTVLRANMVGLLSNLAFI